MDKYACGLHGILKFSDKKAKSPTLKKKLSTRLEIYEFTLRDIAQNLPCPSITIIDCKFRLVVMLGFLFN
jgi:hypothetical protein